MSARREDAAIPLLRPQLPGADRLLPYLRRIDETRYYTNFGPLVRSLEARLAERFGVAAEDVAVVANGTTALSAALLAFGAPPGSTCLLPSWTFVASAAAVCAANLVPRFVDVAPETWMLDPDALLRRDLRGIGAVMAVAPFGTPFETARWDAFTARTGIPVLIDAAACFDAVASVPSARPGRSAIMISLHATKVLGCGEGGLVVSTDRAVIHRIRQVCNFGIWRPPEDQVLGYNGKLSEYHAAVGLAALDAWPERRARLRQRSARYRAELARVPGVTTVPHADDGWVSSYATVRVPGDAEAIVDALAAVGIESRRWWQDGVHRLAAYRDFPCDPLPVTEALAAEVVSLPFSHDLSDAHVGRVVDALGAAIGGYAASRDAR